MPDSISSQVSKYIDQLQLLGSAIALITAMCGIVLFVMWYKTGIPKVLVGKQRAVRVPWDWLEVFLAALLLLFIMDALIITLPWGKHKLQTEDYAGYQISVAASAMQVAADQGLSGGLLTLPGALVSYKPELTRQLEDARSRIINTVLFFPLLLVVFFNVMKRLCGARLYQMGLHLNRWKENFTLGTLVWLVITPICNVLLLILLLHFWETLWGRNTEHPMGMLLMQDSRYSTWILVGILTCVIAPLKEELLLRGVVQPYLVRNPVASDVLVILSIIWAFSNLMTPGTGPDRGMGLGPLLFVFFAAPGYYLFEIWVKPWISEPGAARGIFATSLFFAALHAGAWPQPVPLFLFSLAVGILAYRTRSLIGPITVHILFNLTTMISMLLHEYPNWK
ncbi:MAG: CPBP family intramembrane metalloprotease [Planctomycetia bacterium]|nr:CPBP family intramembrane metalloprotease [Planctomycetia bacterium]